MIEKLDEMISTLEQAKLMVPPHPHIEPSLNKLREVKVLLQGVTLIEDARVTDSPVENPTQDASEPPVSETPIADTEVQAATPHLNETDEVAHSATEDAPDENTMDEPPKSLDTGIDVDDGPAHADEDVVENPEVPQAGQLGEDYPDEA